MKNLFGFIGAGNMGGALATAVSKKVGGENVLIFDKDSEKAENLAGNLGAKALSGEEIAKRAKYIFLGVKPQIIAAALEELLPVLKKREDRFILVSMAAAVSIEKVKELSDNSFPVIRIMPNTPVSIGKGVILYNASSEVSEVEIAEFEDALSLSGMLCPIAEKLIDAGSVISGCGPAFVYLFGEALADAGVECGLSRGDALKFAAATLSGAGELLLTSGKHPGELKDAVCSPGGTTIEGVHSLEDSAFRGAVMNAVLASFEKTKKLSK